MGIQLIELCVSIFFCWLFRSRRLQYPSFFNRIMTIVGFVLLVAVLGSLAIEMMGAHELGDRINESILICLSALSAVAFIVSCEDVVNENSR